MSDMANFGWGYPPGVTGSEIEIAGPAWDGELDRECKQRDVEIDVLGTEAKDLLIANRNGLTTTMVVDFVTSAYTVLLAECPFAGEVDAWASDGVLHWTCPVCGYEYDEDRDDE